MKILTNSSYTLELTQKEKDIIEELLGIDDDYLSKECDFSDDEISKINEMFNEI